MDANQLVCSEVDGEYVVDIRKPRRLVLLHNSFHYSSPRLYSAFLFVFFVQEILRPLFYLIYFCLYYRYAVSCSIYLPSRALVMLDTATMEAVYCAQRANPSMFTTFFLTRRHWIELKKFPCHKRHQSAVTLLGRRTNLSSPLKTGHCSYGNYHQSAKASKLSSPLCSNSIGIKASLLLSV